MKHIFILLLSLISILSFSQPCLIGYQISISPNQTQFACGDPVDVCITINNWDLTAANWIHGIVPQFGPEWDQSTLLITQLPTSVTTGTWGWYNSVNGFGPGVFYDLDNDGNPGNNFGDLSTTGPWTLCFTINVNSPCNNNGDLSINFDILSDSESGSWGSIGCTNDINPTIPLSTLDCPTSGIGTSINVCSYSTQIIDLFDLLSNEDVGGNWIINSNPTDNIFDPTIDLEGQYIYSISSIGCPISTTSVNVDIIDDPNPSFFVTPDSGCVPLSIHYEVITSGSVTWNFGNTTSSSLVGDHILYDLGNQIINLEVSESGCIWNYLDSVQVLGNPDSDFHYYPSLILTDDVVKFSSFESGNWIVDVDTNFNSMPSLDTSFSMIGSHEICLFIIDEYGCYSTTCKSIEVHDRFYVYIPNSFTPNSDGVNDLFYPSIVGGEIIQMNIFNEWGQLIYDGKDPWIGTSHTELYQYRIITSDISGKKFTYIGHILCLN